MEREKRRKEIHRKRLPCDYWFALDDYCALKRDTFKYSRREEEENTLQTVKIRKQLLYKRERNEKRDNLTSAISRVFTTVWHVHHDFKKERKTPAVNARERERGTKEHRK